MTNNATAPQPGNLLYVPAIASKAGNLRGFYVRLTKAEAAYCSPAGWFWIDGERARRDGSRTTDKRPGQRHVYTLVDITLCTVIA